MKRLLTWLGLALGLVVVALLGFVAFLWIAPYPSYEPVVPTVTVASTPERVAHGRRLALSLCVACHENPETKTVSGKLMADMPPEFGTVYSKNITQHKTQGIGGWTDGELLGLLRTGIHPRTGQFVPPWMPRFNRMADEDLESIIAWFRSDDPIVAATNQTNTAGSPTLLTKFLMRVVMSPTEMPSQRIDVPSTANMQEFGRYVANDRYSCFGCHSADFADQDEVRPENSAGFYGGGMTMPDLVGRAVYVPNLTAHATNGLGKWTEAEFVQAMSTGINRNGKPFRYPMARHNMLTPEEHAAIYAYLRSVPVLEGTPSSTPEYAESAEKGPKGLYFKHGCAGCHGATGMGAASLLKAHDKYPDDSVLADVIRNITRYNPEAWMPEYASVMSESDATQLALHVRTLCSKR